MAHAWYAGTATRYLLGALARLCACLATARRRACLQIALPPGTAAADVAAAQRLLTSPYPPPLSITPEGGAVARVPQRFPSSSVHGRRHTVMSGVAVCS